MSTAWDNYHLRTAQLRDVIAQLDRSPDEDVVWDPSTTSAFADLDDLLRALHEVWTRRLTAAVENALEVEGGGVDAVGRAWQLVSDQLPTVRHVLDHYADHPTMRHQELLEHRMLAVAAGLAPLNAPLAHSARLGAELVRRFATNRRPHTVPA